MYCSKCASGNSNNECDYEWNEHTFTAAVNNGDLKIMKWLYRSRLSVGY